MDKLRLPRISPKNETVSSKTSKTKTLTYREFVERVNEVYKVNKRSEPHPDDESGIVGAIVAKHGNKDPHKMMHIDKIKTHEGDDKTAKGSASKHSESNIRRMVQHLRQGKKLDPIVVHKLTKSEDGVTHQVLDGHHRLEAHKRLGRKSIPVTVVNKRNVKDV